MNRRQLKALMAVNLRLVNPQITNRYRKKGKSGTELTKKLEYQFLINTILFMFIYGLTMLRMDFSKLPGMFTFYMMLFVLLAFSQSISGIYNIFFMGKDLASYLPLPFRQKEIFFSKILVVVLNIFPFTLPLLLVFILTGWHFGIIIPIAIILGLLVYVMVLAVIVLLCALIVFALSKTKLFQNHQNIVMNMVIGATMIIAVLGIVMMNGNTQAGTSSIDRSVIPVFLPIYQLFQVPFSMISGLTWLSLLIILGILLVILRQAVFPHLSEQLTSSHTNSLSASKKHRQIRRSGIKAKLNGYNRRLLNEPNLLVQVILNSIMVPMILIISFSFSLSNIPKNLAAEWVGVFFVAGLVFSSLTINQSSLVSNLISLDRKNFEFVRSLPISLRQYLAQKFKLGYFTQVSLNIILIVIVGIVWHLEIIMLFSMILGTILGTYLLSLYYFKRDYQLRLTDWTNVSELFNRGGGNFAMMLMIFAVVFIGMIILLAYSLAIIYLNSAWFINCIVVLLIAISAGLFIRHYQKEFWKKFS
ncbi:ABC transporter permease [Companilactobacillus crustorum]|uniref:ABC transporter permease n=1 Tax=Companilactobacillus crustorum TaxID=392416 RepID=UPI00237E07E7|nr:ABC transporter permease [Companilactobacillus crustorum]WDT66666.1 ABC transporter permease [Companilactobacillus crustorum]